MKKIAFEKVDYKPYQLVTYLISQTPNYAKKRDPRILPLLDGDGRIKKKLLNAIRHNFDAFKKLIDLEITQDTKSLCWNESSNLLAHLLCAQRHFGGVKKFGTTKSSSELQRIISANKIENRQSEISEDEDESDDYYTAESQLEKTVVEAPQLIDIIASLRNKERDALRNLSSFLKGMDRDRVKKELIVRGQSPSEYSDLKWEEGSLMHLLSVSLPEYLDCYGLESVLTALRQLPFLAIADIKEEYKESDNETVKNFIAHIKTVASFIENAGDFILLKSTKSRKMAMTSFVKLPTKHSDYVDACRIIKDMFGYKKLNAPIFSREITAMLNRAGELPEANRRELYAGAIRLCAAADRFSFVTSLLLPNENVKKMLTEESNPYIQLFSDKIKNKLQLGNYLSKRLSPEDLLASRPLTVKLSDVFGLYSVRPTQALPKSESVVYQP